MPAPGKGSQTVAKAMEVVKLVSSRRQDGMRLNDVAEVAGLSKPTAHRLLKELASCGLLMRSADRRYFLGQFAYELGLSAAAHFHLRETCAPHAMRVAEATGDTVFVVVRSGADSFCLDRHTGSYPIKAFTVDVGNRQPLGVGAGGLALLSWLAAEERDEALRLNSGKLEGYGGLTEDRLRALVDQARRQGYARTADFAVRGVTGIGMPVLDRVGSPILAMSVTSVSTRMTQEHQRTVLEILEGEILKMQVEFRNATPDLRHANRPQR